MVLAGDNYYPEKVKKVKEKKEGTGQDSLSKKNLIQKLSWNQILIQDLNALVKSKLKNIFYLEITNMTFMERQHVSYLKKPKTK